MEVASLVIAIAAVVIAGISTGIAGFSAWYARSGLREARIGNALPGALEFLGEYRETEADRRFILRDLEAVAEPERGISDLPEKYRVRVVRVSHYLDHLGLLVDQELVEADVVYRFIGGSVIRLWEVLAPYIEAESRRRGNAEYQFYFRSLARRMGALQS